MNMNEDEELYKYAVDVIQMLDAHGLGNTLLREVTDLICNYNYDIKAAYERARLYS